MREKAFSAAVVVGQAAGALGKVGAQMRGRQATASTWMFAAKAALAASLPSVQFA